MSCSTSIVECLINEGIEPEVIDIQWLHDYKPEYAINYSTNKGPNEYFCPIESSNIWTLDFKMNILITGYQINSGTGNNRVYNWNFFIKKNEVWLLADSQQNNL